jgi:hypothetical protein
MSPLPGSPPALGSRLGTWEALGAIAYGFVIYPLNPNKPSRGLSRNLSPSGGLHTLREEPENENDADPLQYSDQAALDIGDEVYAFERLVADARSGAVWYRGFVSALSGFIIPMDPSNMHSGCSS